MSQENARKSLHLFIEIKKGEVDVDWKIRIFENPSKVEAGSEDIIIIPIPFEFRLWYLLLPPTLLLPPDFPVLLRKIENTSGLRFSKHRHKKEIANPDGNLMSDTQYHCTTYTAEGEITEEDYKNILSIFEENKILSFLGIKRYCIYDLRTPPNVGSFLRLEPGLQTNILGIMQGSNSSSNDGHIGPIYANQVRKPYEKFKNLTTSEKIDFFIQKINEFLEIYNNIDEPKKLGENYLEKKNQIYTTTIKYFQSFLPWFTPEDDLKEISEILSQKNGNTRIGIENLLKYLTSIQKIYQDPLIPLDDRLPTITFLD